MELPKNLKDEIWDYCRLNNISNIDEFTLKLVKQGFSIEKYGIPTNKVVEKEVEKIIEIPVEKIIEVPVADSKAYDDLNLEYTKLKLQNEELIKQNTKLKTEKDIYGES
jgi:hypothetical protein